MIGGTNQKNLGIEGFGPDNTLYLSVLAAHGIHKKISGGTWGFTDPPATSTMRPVWRHLNSIIRKANTKRLRISDLYDDLAAPPYGVRAGIAPVIVLAALIVASDEVAFYEHGTFRPLLADDILERFLRNPINFEVKHYATRKGVRATFLTEVANTLQIPARRSATTGRVGSVLAVVSHLVALSNTLPEHIKKTLHLSPDAIAVRRVLLFATEPDVLLFNEIPEAFGLPPVPATGTYNDTDISELANRLGAVCLELRAAYAKVLDDIEQALAEHVGPSCVPLREGLAARARELDGKIIDSQVAKLTVALTAEIPDRTSWLAYIAMNVSGVPPEGWSDEDRKRFFVTIAEVGATFRRIHALNANLEARGDGFDAYRNVITRTDGTEIVQLIALDESARAAGQPLLDDAIKTLEKTLKVSVAEARTVLIGLLGEADFAANQPRSAELVTPTTYGEDTQTKTGEQ